MGAGGSHPRGEDEHGARRSPPPSARGERGEPTTPGDLHHSGGAAAAAMAARGWVKSRSLGSLVPARTDDVSSVLVKVMPLMQSKAGGEVKSYKVTSAGAVLQGGMPPEIRDVAKEYEKLTALPVDRIYVDDRRAQQLLVSYVGEDYFVVPAPELFSRHTGACRILGDKHQRTADYPLQVGDFLRIGSVGLVVSEIHTGEGLSTVISESDLAYLREDVTAIRDDLFVTQEAATAAEEATAPGLSPRTSQCYMCFDDEDSVDNPLVAPCNCKGGTRYVHLICLQRWQSAAGEDKDCVVSTAEKRNSCKVCKTRYKTHVRTTDGRLVPLMVHQLPPPYICFLVVTRHETAEDLFNTQFQLSFADQRQIVIGRSRNCDMVLDYRTVSTQHATVTFKKGTFVFRDLNSSNGSMLNLRRPLKLPWNQWVRIRYGRSIVALKAKRSWVRRKLSALGGSSRQLDLSGSDVSLPEEQGSGKQLRVLESLCTIDLSPRLLMSPDGSESLGGRRQFMSFMSESMSPSVGGGAGGRFDSGEFDDSERRKARPANLGGRSQSLGRNAFRQAPTEPSVRRGPTFIVPSPMEVSQASQLST